jgi:hypothetical protein
VNAPGNSASSSLSVTECDGTGIPSLGTTDKGDTPEDSVLSMDAAKDEHCFSKLQT